MLLLEDLNDQQREAVIDCENPLLVIAGAGSGKTRVITHKIAFLIRDKNIAPRRIFAATFTNKAAGEMKHRVTRLLGIPFETPMNVATFHSLCAKLLRREAPRIGISRNFMICDEKDQLALIKACYKELGLTEKCLTYKQAQNLINQIKLRMAKPEDFLDHDENPQMTEMFIRLYNHYHKRMKDNEALDFEDLICRFIELLQNDDQVKRYYNDLFQYILVDEFQDTNFSQYQLVKLLLGAQRHICVVGDEDQSIYSWRGAEIHNLLGFADDFPDARIIKLEQNYRSTGNILEAASHVISNNTQRLGKWLWTSAVAGEPLYLIQAADEIDEAKRVARQIARLHNDEGIALDQIAVFYRQSSLSRLIEDKLREEKIPYRVIGGIRFYDRAEIKDLTSYLRVIANPESTISMQRIINRPKRGLGQKTVDTLLNWAIEHNTSLYQAMVEALDNNILPAGTTGKIGDFLAMLHRWRRLASHAKPNEVLNRIIEDTNYLDSLGDPKSLEAIGKKDNIQQLRDALSEYLQEHPDASLEDYLESVALSTHVDEMRDDTMVSLMTIHCAKGLEFRVVFLVGLDEPIFPSHRTLDETGEVEEERRLFYVGLTRCKELLFISRANVRRIYGKKQMLVPSRFLNEIPPNLRTSYMERLFA